MNEVVLNDDPKGMNQGVGHMRDGMADIKPFSQTQSPIHPFRVVVRGGYIVKFQHADMIRDVFILLVNVIFGFVSPRLTPCKKYS